MRTTLTIDDDLLEELQKRAKDSNKSLKVTVNEVIRRGLSAGQPITPAAKPFKVEARSCGFQPGIDPAKLHQLLDDLETDDFVSHASETLRVADS
ncbi:MAG TPA: ribbon-helix-helix protein, CopG family [Thermoanaerobaculia bacterium]